MTAPRRHAASAGIVLAGGRSRRFGRDKRFAVVQGVPLLERVLSVVADVADLPVLVLAPGESVPSLPTELAAMVRVAHDREAYAGPLAGLVAGLRAVPDLEVAVVVGADMPTLEPAVLRLLLDRTRQAPGAWTLEGPDPALIGPLPLAGDVARLLEAAAALLGSGERSLRSLVRAAGAGRVPATEWRAFDPDGRTLRDVDRPEDLASPTTNPLR